ncbi:MAG: hypothetical protein EBZ77_09860, partial [Chitinophagia bacterium]|nr:hypothetical protein [Chitinophagia bacterium]
MTFFKSVGMGLAALLLTVAYTSEAQYKFAVQPFYKYFRDARRWEIGGSYVTATGTFNGVVPIYGYNNRFITDSTLKRDIVSEPGFGVLVGVNVPVARLGHVSVLALSIDIAYNQYAWKELNKSYNLDGTFKTLPNKLDAKTTQVAAPIGLDYKYGCDAINSKRMRLGATLGIGAIPHFNVTKMDSVSKLFGPQQSLGFNPYAKAELSFYFGLCIKLRAMYTVGNVELMNLGTTPVEPYTHGPFKLTNTSNTVLSVILMPFSYKWRERGWYDTYDTYNWNERLN